MPISTEEFNLLRNFILKHSEIEVKPEKTYLIESRLSRMMVELGASNFKEFYHNAQSDSSGKLRERIIDAMTTNETFWFRDSKPWALMRETIFPQLIEAKRKRGIGSKIRIWSAACSTGQEPYSIAMILDDMLTSGRYPGVRGDDFEIMATDISPSVLYLANAGRYNQLAMSRGLSDEYRNRYFTQQLKIWEVNPSLKSRITFKKFNLQDHPSSLGRFDFVLCRNVAIYFTDQFKRELFRRIHGTLNPPGFFLLGSSESLVGYSTDFDMAEAQGAIYYKLK
jgi:chemotaxis protein methyltransferase CheR